MMFNVVVLVLLPIVGAQFSGKNECRDLMPTCEMTAFQCKNPHLRMSMETTCRRTCGFCQETECKDYNMNCQFYQKNGLCNSGSFFIKNSCRKSCGLCGDNNNQPTTPSNDEHDVTEQPDDHTQPPFDDETEEPIDETTDEASD